jgi:hypothetical protein
MKNPRLLSRKFDIVSFSMRMDGNFPLVYIPLRQNLTIKDPIQISSISHQGTNLGKDFKKSALS